MKTSKARKSSKMLKQHSCRQKYLIENVKYFTRAVQMLMQAYPRTSDPVDRTRDCHSGHRTWDLSKCCVEICAWHYHSETISTLSASSCE